MNRSPVQAPNAPAARRLQAALAPPGERTRVPEAARAAGLSTRQAYRAAERTLGETPAAHARRRNLDRAAVALLGARRTILAIALDHGFASPEVFSRAFRRQFGVLPSIFRRNGGRGLRPAFRVGVAFALHQTGPR